MASKTTKKSKSDDDPKNNIFIVERVVDKRVGKAGRDEFLIQWQGFSAKDSSWEPRENLQCVEMLAEFEAQFDKNSKQDRKRKASPHSDEDGEGDVKDKYGLSGKQLKCIIGLTKSPGELHFLCKFSDDTARLLPAKEVNSRFRPFVDEYAKFVRRKMERRQKRIEDGKRRDEEEDDEEWPPLPPGYRILTSEEKERQMREESRNTNSSEPQETFQPSVSEMLHDLQMAGAMMSSFPPDPLEEAVMAEPLLSVFDDTMDSPVPCPIVIDTVPDDDGLLFTD